MDHKDNDDYIYAKTLFDSAKMTYEKEMEDEITVKALEDVFNKFMRAQNIFRNINFKDSMYLAEKAKEYMASIENKLNEIKKEEGVREELNENDVQKSGKNKKKRIIICGIVAALVFLGVIICHLQIDYLIPNKNYKNAVNQYNKGLYSVACSMFEKNREFKDSKEYIKKCVEESNNYEKVEVGSKILMGKYNDKYISWIVCDIKNDCAYLMSESTIFDRVLDRSMTEKKYWKQTALRNELNTEVINEIFTNDEKERIQDYDGDKLFIPSLSKIKSYDAYINIDKELRDHYYTGTGGYVEKYFLRTTNDGENYYCVLSDGKIETDYFTAEGGIRLAMYIKLK